MNLPTQAPRLAITVAVLLLVAGGLLLLSARGTAILLDLAAMAWACF